MKHEQWIKLIKTDYGVDDKTAEEMKKAMDRIYVRSELCGFWHVYMIDGEFQQYCERYTMPGRCECNGNVALCPFRKEGET